METFSMSMFVSKEEFYKAKREALERENEAILAVAKRCERQHYGLRNAWAGIYRKCDKHGPYAVGGNWQDEETCPLCDLIAALPAQAAVCDVNHEDTEPCNGCRVCEAAGESRAETQGVRE